MAYDKDVRTVLIGNQNCYIYPMSKEGFGEAIKQLGMRAFTRKITQDDTNLFADNKVHVSVAGTKQIEGEFTFYQLDPQVYALMGFNYNPDNYVLSDGGTKKKFAMAFTSIIADEYGERKMKLYVAYGISASEPEKDKKTMEDKVEGEELKSSYTASATSLAKDYTGAECSFMEVETDMSEDEITTMLEAGCPVPTDDFSSKGGALAINGETTVSVTQTSVQGSPSAEDLLSKLEQTITGGDGTYTISIEYNGTALTYPLPETIAANDYILSITVVDGTGKSVNKEITATVTV